MCGRYSLTTSNDNLAQRFDFNPNDAKLLQSNNITPSKLALIIASPKGQRLPAPMTWGFPSQRPDNGPYSRIINARSETAADKPTFSYSFANRRCLVPANSFFESKPTQYGKRPYRIQLNSGAPFAIAGIWKPRHTSGAKPIFEFVILTVPPNDQVAEIHDRMPAILLPQHEALWLDPSFQDPAELRQLLQPYPSHLMEAHPAPRPTALLSA